MIPKVEWSALLGAADSLGHLNDLPTELIPDYENDEEFLRKVHHVLLEKYSSLFSLKSSTSVVCVGSESAGRRRSRGVRHRNPKSELHIQNGGQHNSRPEAHHTKHSLYRAC
nr:PREDICTED: multifunctional methyltransferase subunit TRM112-like protein isoform X3 [Latimeria chalumnae]|eukprot:XP_014339438.1 PREDICTED: multifunctional methyltransferase subunit TRM112-like protein isoform X3 [Latimeria chalumnae]